MDIHQKHVAFKQCMNCRARIFSTNIEDTLCLTCFKQEATNRQFEKLIDLYVDCLKTKLLVKIKINDLLTVDEQKIRCYTTMSKTLIIVFVTPRITRTQVRKIYEIWEKIPKIKKIHVLCFRKAKSLTNTKYITFLTEDILHELIRQRYQFTGVKP